MALGKNLTKKAREKTVSQQVQQKAEPAKVEEKQTDEEAINSDEASDDSKDHVLNQQFCVFKSANEEYAIPINLVREVVHFPKVAPVAQMPPYITGMTNVRGNIYGVLDLGVFFSGDTDESIQPKYLLVLKHDVYQIGVGIPDVPDNLIVSENMIEQLSSSRLKSTVGQKYLKGIIKKDRRMIILFDILGMISSDQFTKN